MEKLEFSIEIDAPKQKVWDTMLNDQTYRQWTEVFNPSGGSYYEGDWSAGSKMRFLGPDEEGNLRGMFCLVRENRPYEFISLQHLGELINGEEKPWPEEMTNGQRIHENYTLRESGYKTEVVVSLDTNEQFKEMFQDMWPKALEKLKELAEK